MVNTKIMIREKKLCMSRQSRVSARCDLDYTASVITVPCTGQNSGYNTVPANSYGYLAYQPQLSLPPPYVPPPITMQQP